MGKKISIIIPVYNASNHLKQCLDSILEQTHKNTEVILVNDCSLDNSLDICYEYEAKDSRVVIVNHDVNLGTGGARASGIAAATGYYIGWVDSDDWLDLHMFEDLIYKLEESNADIIQCKYFLVTAERVLQTKDTNCITEYNNIEAVRSLLELNIIDTVFWNKVFRKSVFNGVDMSLLRYGLEDTDTLYKLLYNTRKVVFFDKSYYYYRQAEGTLSSGMISAAKAVSTLEVDRNKLKYFEKRCPELIMPCKQKLLSKLISVYYMLDTESSTVSEVNSITPDILKNEIRTEISGLYKDIKKTYTAKRRIFFMVLQFSTKRNIISKAMSLLIHTRYKRNGYRYSAVTSHWFEVRGI